MPSSDSTQGFEREKKSTTSLFNFLQFCCLIIQIVFIIDNISDKL